MPRPCKTRVTCSLLRVLYNNSRPSLARRSVSVKDMSAEPTSGAGVGQTKTRQGGEHVNSPARLNMGADTIAGAAWGHAAYRTPGLCPHAAPLAKDAPAFNHTRE